MEGTEPPAADASAPPEPRLFRVPDRAFVGLLRERDPQAWDELRGFLRRLATRKAWGDVDRGHAPDDYVQLACLRLWNAISRPGFDDGSVRLKAYLAVTMRNLVTEAHRQRGGLTHIPRAGDGGNVVVAGAGELDVSDAFTPAGLPRAEALEAEYERRAGEAFAALEALAAHRKSYVREIARTILERTQARSALSLAAALDSNLFRLVYPDAGGWSGRKKNKYRVRLNRFREAFLVELARVRQGRQAP